MPLLISPIDGSPMKQINRYGIELDICPTTGGVWLDRGELEKLMSLLRAEDDDDRYERDERRPEQTRHYKQDDDDYRHKDKYGYGHVRKPKSKMSKIMDIFDL